MRDGDKGGEGDDNSDPERDRECDVNWDADA